MIGKLIRVITLWGKSDEYKAVDVLKRTRKLLHNPNRWTKGADAKDKYGIPVGWDRSDAAKFCLTGALQHELGVDGMRSQECWIAWEALSHSVYPKAYGSIVGFNDSSMTTHKDVLKVIDKAIKTLEANMAQ